MLHCLNSKYLTKACYNLLSQASVNLLVVLLVLLTHSAYASEEFSQLISIEQQYQDVIKSIEDQEHLLSESEKKWSKYYAERLDRYKAILEKLNSIDFSLRKSLYYYANLKEDYNYVVTLWRAFVEGSFVNLSGSNIEIELPTLLSYPSLNLEDGIDSSKLRNIESRYQELKNRYIQFNRNFNISSDKNALYYNKILLYSGKLRSKIYQRLTTIYDKSTYEFSDEILADIWREIRIIPIRWSANFYSKILELKKQLDLGFNGYLMIAEQLFIMSLLFVFLFWFIKSFKDITNYCESIFDYYFQLSKKSNSPWIRQYLSSIFYKSIPLFILQISLFLVQKILKTTSLWEIAEFIPYIRYYLIFRFFVLITSYTITKFKTSNYISGNYVKQTKLLNHLTYTYRFIFINMIVLHTIEAIVGEAIIYRIYHIGFVFIGILYGIYIIDHWRVEIFTYLSKKFSSRVYNFFRPHFYRVYAPVVCGMVFLLIIIKLLMSFIQIWLEQFDFSKKISAQLFLARAKKSALNTQEELIRPLPIKYIEKFENKDSKSNFFIEPKEFIDCRMMIQQWLEGKTTTRSIMASGPYGSGKSTLMDSICQFFSGKTIHRINFDKKTLDTHILLDKLKSILGGEGENIESLIKYWSHKNEKIVICIDNAHNLFLSSPGQFSCVKLLIDIISVNIENIFWVTTFNNYAWNYVSKVLSCSQCFDVRIRLETWSPQDLELLIMTRHKETGYELSYDNIFFDLEKKHLQDTFDYMTSKFFRLLWEQSGGNPKRAATLWLSSLRYNGSRELHVALPPELHISKILDVGNDFLLVCISIVRHEFLSLEHIKLTTKLAEDTLFAILNFCLKKGVLMVDQEKNYQLNPEYSENIIRILKSKNYVH